MQKVNPNKIFTEYRDGVTEDDPIMGRKYTMTHSDETGDLFVTIGLEYAEDVINPTRDEVLLEWDTLGGQLVLYGEVLVEGEGVEGNPVIRERIFMREMPTALSAIRYGDEELFEEYPELDQTPVIIRFRFDDPADDKLNLFGPIGNYAL